MNENGTREKDVKKGNPHYRDTLRLLKSCLRPVEPRHEFSCHLEELCESMGALELFGNQNAGQDEGGHRGIIIGGAIFSALPFVGVAAYAIGKHVLRRRIVPVGI